ncbi:uncharacterized protein LOC111061493 isoform X6 [Nilaparvata lugens]|uniref:uncharacterized protein LOC111061493 isoform X6 n=1 Tax=Nilaparvata lugens TaxID=108931 RepID=UPI00193D1AA0|nr:uncharacterized protein LOC111061493 isoform X6 [Nilaparvata lugens]XP_039282805.1 uncharacterized protein LOC111061493 isoform X6 [Nilaparvata lugens]XP_039282807.1 uncharacterized protein LOC111061493 isoform X6 [Nilaparvata lugens]
MGDQQRTAEHSQQHFVKFTRKGRQDLQSQSKNIISNVLSFFKNLAENPEERKKLNFYQVMKLTAQACDVSVKTVQRIKRTLDSVEDDEEVQFETPRKRYKRNSTKTELNDFEKQVVRDTVFQYYDIGEFPTANKLRIDLEQKIGYSGSEDSVLRLLKSLGFKFRKFNDGRKYLMEHQDIAASRATFLRKMHSIRNESRPIVYLDETWVSQNHTDQYIWQNSNNSGGLKVPTGKEERLIIAHAGSATTGFIPDAKLVFREGERTQNCDYHSEMNSSLFKEWFVDKLLCRLEEGSVIVMDNASYHSALRDKIPDSKWKKNEIIEWLSVRNIPHDPTLTNAELLSIKEIKTAENRYELDCIANEMGHEVVRLPPYHCLYNPIEWIWAQVKREVASRNTTFKLADVEKLTNDVLDNVTKEDWAKCVEQAEDLQEADFQKQCSRDIIMEPIVIDLADSSDVSDIEIIEDD